MERYWSNVPEVIFLKIITYFELKDRIKLEKGKELFFPELSFRYVYFGLERHRGCLLPCAPHLSFGTPVKQFDWDVMLIVSCSHNRLFSKLQLLSFIINFKKKFDPRIIISRKNGQTIHSRKLILLRYTIWWCDVVTFNYLFSL